MTVKLYSQTLLPTRYGQFNVYVFRDEQQVEHLAIIKGQIGTGEDLLVRVHSECLTSEVLGSLKCDCKEQLEYALQAIEKAGRGLVVYLRQEGRGIGLGNKIKAYQLQEQGLDTLDANLQLGFGADLRVYNHAIEIMQYFGVQSLRLLTNNPQKFEQLESHFKVLSREPIVVATNAYSQSYLETKRDRMGHLIQSIPIDKRT